MLDRMLTSAGFRFLNKVTKLTTKHKHWTIFTINQKSKFSIKLTLQTTANGVCKTEW